MVFLVLMYRGHFFAMAYWKQLCAKPWMDYTNKKRNREKHIRQAAMCDACKYMDYK